MPDRHPNPNVSCSARFRQYTIGGSDIDIKGDGDAPCRGIVLLSVGAGNLVVTPANPISEVSPDETFDVTALPAGTLLPLELETIKHAGSVGGLKILVLW